MMDRGYLLRRLALVFGAIGLVLLGWYAWAVPKTLRVAVGPADSAQHRFVQAMARAMKDTQQAYKLEIVPVPDSSAASAALDKHKADLAVLRSDDGTSAEARSIAVLQRRQIVIIARRSSGIATVSDLKGRSTALLNMGSESDRAVLNAILAHFELSSAQLAMDEIDVQSLIGSEKRHDAYILFANAASGLARQVLDAVAKQGDGEVVLIGLPGAEGLALRLRELQKEAIPAGAFGGSPPSPAEALPSVSFSYELVATSNLGQTDAKELLSNLMEARTRIRRLLPRTSFDIESPPIDERRRFLPHIGAAAYVNDDEAETFLETYSEQIWLALFALSIVGSSIAGLLGWTGYFDSTVSRDEMMEQRIRALAERLATAGDVAALDAARAELDTIVLGYLKEHGRAPAGGSEPSWAPWIASLNGIIERRRAANGAPQPPR